MVQDGIRSIKHVQYGGAVVLAIVSFDGSCCSFYPTLSCLRLPLFLQERAYI